MKKRSAWLAGAAAVVGLTLVGADALATPDDARTLGRRLKKAVGAQDSEAIQRVCEDLIALGGADGVEEVIDLIPKLDRVDEDTYWQMISAATGFTDRAALAELGEFILKEDREPYARDLLFTLANNPSPHTVAALGPILKEGPYDLQLMAADQLALVETVPSVDALIDQLRDEGDDGDPGLRRRIMVALRSITGEAMGDPLNWIGWWEANRDSGLPDKERGGSEGGGLASSTLDPGRQNEFESLERNPKRIIVISSRLPDDWPHDPGRDYNYDHMENVLSQMDIPHTVVLKADFNEEPRKYLEEAWTILVNCAQVNEHCICDHCRQNLGGAGGNRMFTCPASCPNDHPKFTYKINNDNGALDMLKAWVEAGGYLFTEDWGLVEVLDETWPEMVSSQSSTEPGPDGNPTDVLRLIRALTDKTDPESINQGGHMDVKIAPARGATSLPLMRGVFNQPRQASREEDAPEGDDDGGTRVRPTGLGGSESAAAVPDNTWMIDDESPPIGVHDRGVRVLLESEELFGILALEGGRDNARRRRTGGGGSSPVAVTFRVGRGDPSKHNRDPERPRTGDDRGRSRGRGAWAEELQGGRVVHCLSHFGKQQGGGDTFVIQNLILNFIMESNRQHTR